MYGAPPPPWREAITKAEAFAQEDIVVAAQIRHDRGIAQQNQAHCRHVAPPADKADLFHSRLEMRQRRHRSSQRRRACRCAALCAHNGFCVASMAMSHSPPR